MLCENSGPDVEWLMDKFGLDLSLVRRDSYSVRRQLGRLWSVLDTLGRSTVCVRHCWTLGQDVFLLNPATIHRSLALVATPSRARTAARSASRG